MACRPRYVWAVTLLLLLEAALVQAQSNAADSLDYSLTSATGKASSPKKPKKGEAGSKCKLDKANRKGAKGDECNDGLTCCNDPLNDIGKNGKDTDKKDKYGVCAEDCNSIMPPSPAPIPLPTPGGIPPATPPSPSPPPPLPSPSPSPAPPASPAVRPSTAPAPGVPPEAPPPVYVDAAVLNPACVAKYQLPLLLPPIMPKLTGAAALNPQYDEYEISAREIMQTVLPTSKPVDAPPECASYIPTPQTKVWAYGTVDVSGSTTHNWPSFTIEATRSKPLQVKWVNQLVDSSGRYLQHMFADQLEQTLHWANPGRLGGMTDHSPCHGCPGAACNTAACTTAASTKYTGPVPLVPHVHGSQGVRDDSDGYTEAWFMPDAVNDANFAQNGSWHGILKQRALATNPSLAYGPGYVTYNYPTDQRPTQLWYHDHSLGITRLNVYAGLAGFFMVRDAFPQNSPELPGLPYPPPGRVAPELVRELPLAIQDRAFDVNNQLYYPKQDNLTLPPTDALPLGPVPPTWVPEFSASLPDGSDATLMTVNGRVAPRHPVLREPYRLRILNGCNSKTLIIYFSTTQPTLGQLVAPDSASVPFWVVGNEGGFLPFLVGPITQVLLGPAERYDIVIDFSAVDAASNKVYMLNKGPGLPYDGANVGDGTTIHIAQVGSSSSSCTAAYLQVMLFDIQPAPAVNPPFNATVRATLSSAMLAKFNSAPTTLPPATKTRQFTLLEEFGTSGNPAAQFLGTVGSTSPANLLGIKQLWMSPVTALTAPNTVEEWTIINLTADAHPIHIHESYFEATS
uniref:Plastocyanin-like domain-containing protein n=1 Tax=Tetradesmus obliquus TaxID=3088 RepID=A0A383VIA1_TETOB|eukprot:jgi/Sobl393_1/20133/SZX64660.1